MKTSVAALKPGDVVALMNLKGRRLAVVSQTDSLGFQVGRRRYHWDGRGRDHSESVAQVPLDDEVRQHQVRGAVQGPRLIPAGRMRRPHSDRQNDCAGNVA